MCSSRKIHAHPMEGYWKFLGVGGILKAKFVEEMYENKAQIPRGGGGVQNKKPFMGEYGYFLELHSNKHRTTRSLC